MLGYDLQAKALFSGLESNLVCDRPKGCYVGK
jgi:hypothetical protein